MLTHGYLPSDKGYYHGGDLEGLRRRLPYLDQLGITAIWVGPIYANKPVQSDTTDATACWSTLGRMSGASPCSV